MIDDVCEHRRAAILDRISIDGRAEYQAEDAKLAALLGTEFQALGARTIALTRRFETREAVARPDLSVPR